MMESTAPQSMPAWDVPHVPLEEPQAQAPSPQEDAPLPSPVKEDAPDQPPSVSPTPPGAALVRFLNAVMDGAPLRISTGGRLLRSSLSVGQCSPYFTVPHGFRPFTFTDASRPWLLLYRTAVPLSEGDVVTLALVRCSGGLDLVRVDDRFQGVRGTQESCLRCIDLVTSAPALDLSLTDGRVIFTGLSFKESSNYRRLRPGRYDLSLTQTPLPFPLPRTDIETVEDLPMVIPSAFLPGQGLIEPLGSFLLEVRPASAISIYILGDWELSPQLQVHIAENF